MAGRKRKIRAGDVFRFEVLPNRFAYGQVVFSDILQYVVIYREIMDGMTPLSNLNSSAIILSGWTTDAKMQAGDWEIIGRIDPPSEVLLREYQVAMSDQTWVTDVHGRALRPATKKEEASLYFKSSQSPMLYEDAFKACHGLARWESYFNKLLQSSYDENGPGNSE